MPHRVIAPLSAAAGSPASVRRQVATDLADTLTHQVPGENSPDSGGLVLVDLRLTRPKFVLYVKWLFFTSPLDPHFWGFFDGKRIRTNRSNHCAARVFRFVLIIPYGHTSTTYKLKLSGGDIKAVQGDTGHAQATMVTERYAHILDDDRRVNAVRFQKEFYGGGKATESEEAIAASSSEDTRQAPVGDPLQNLDAATKQQLLLKLLAESPDMSALLTALAGRSA